MIIRKLEVAGLRAFEQAKFEFQPGMNLLVGVNGVGKTTALDALRISLSRVLPQITSSRAAKVSVEASDISIWASFMQIECTFEFQGKIFKSLLHKQKQQFVVGRDGQIINTNDRDDTIPSDLTGLFPGCKQSQEQPLGVYFSVRRALYIDQKLSPASAVGGQAQAFAESFSLNRDFNIREIAEWIHAKNVLGEEDPRANFHREAMRQAADVFLPNCRDLQVVEIDGAKHLMVNKNGVPLNVRQLSDGERGALGLVLDLARRLSQANPGLDNPVAEGRAIVLIDELDLHLHPKWQRTIVENLTRTFPNCQFIATTHSPQIIGEVNESKIIIMFDGKNYKPAASYGVDSNRILEEIMGVDARSVEIKSLLNHLFDLIDDEDLVSAKAKLVELRKFIGSDDPEIIRAQTLIDFLED